MPSQSYTFFFTPDAHRATDRTEGLTWTSPAMSSSGSLQVGWVKPKPS